MEKEEFPWKGLVFRKFIEAYGHDGHFGGSYANGKWIPKTREVEGYQRSYQKMKELIEHHGTNLEIDPFFLPLIAHILEKEPKSESELRELINRSLKDKRILEVGPANTYYRKITKPNKMLFLKRYGADVVGIDLENGTPWANEYKEKYGLKKIITIPSNHTSCISKMEEELKKYAPFDMIYSNAVFYDGDINSMRLEDHINQRWVDAYHKFLRKGGIAYHSPYELYAIGLSEPAKLEDGGPYMNFKRSGSVEK